MVINGAQVYLDNWIATYNYILIEFTVYDLCATRSPQVFTQMLHVTDAPYIANFELIYEDPNGDPFYSGPYPYDPIVFQPSQDIENPVDLGSGTGRIFVISSTSNFQSWDIIVSRDKGFGYVPVGGKNGGSPGGLAGSFRLGSPSLYDPLNGYQLTDNPTNNIGEVYKIELTLGSPACPDATEWSYFRFPSSLVGYRTTGGSTDPDEVNDIWHTQQDNGSLSIHLSPDVHIGTVTISLYNLAGQKVFEQQNLAGSEIKLAEPNVSTGIYILQVYGETGQLLYNSKVLYQ